MSTSSAKKGRAKKVGPHIAEAGRGPSLVGGGQSESSVESSEVLRVEALDQKRSRSSAREARVKKVRAEIEKAISDPSVVGRIQQKFGDVLRRTTLGNYTSLQKISKRMVDGYILAQEMMAKGSLVPDMARPEDGKHSHADLPLHVPSEIRTNYPDCLRTTWLWARKMWNILILNPSPTKPEDLVCTIWRFWEGVSVLPDKQYSDLVHTSFFDETMYPKRRPFSFYSYESVPKDVPGALFHRKGKGSLTFKARISNPQYSSSGPRDIRRETGEPAYSEASLGYKYVCPWVLSEKSTDSEVFGTQSGCNCEQVNFLLSLPNQWVHTRADEPFLKVHDFYPTSDKTNLSFFTDVIDKIPTSEDGLIMSEINSVWNKDRPRARRIMSDRDLSIPSPLAEDLPDLFEQDRSVFHATLEYPNPLKSLAVSWRARR